MHKKATATALMGAALNGHYEIVKMLRKEFGADVNVQANVSYIQLNT